MVNTGEIIAHGAYKNTKWSIDANGLLEVKGTGDMYELSFSPPWDLYSEKIKSARIKVKGAKNLEGLFWGCKNLTNVDLSNLDTSKATSMDYMFWRCTSLKITQVQTFQSEKFELE